MTKEELVEGFNLMMAAFLAIREKENRNTRRREVSMVKLGDVYHGAPEQRRGKRNGGDRV